MNIPFFSCSSPFKLHKYSDWSEPKVIKIFDTAISKEIPIEHQQMQARICKDCGFVKTSNRKLS